MLLTIVRSGLGESTHEVDICAIDAGGNELLTSGDPGRAIYYRSTVKPFQATIALEAGLDVPPPRRDREMPRRSPRQPSLPRIASAWFPTPCATHLPMCPSR